MEKVTTQDVIRMIDNNELSVRLLNSTGKWRALLLEYKLSSNIYNEIEITSNEYIDVKRLYEIVANDINEQLEWENA